MLKKKKKGVERIRVTLCSSFKIAKKVFFRNMGVVSVRYAILFNTLKKSFRNNSRNNMPEYLGQWLTEYEVGIEDIDLQHHFFFNLINRLARELARTRDIQYKMDLINELTAYAKFHFTSEENMMRRAGYPQFMHHKFQHLELIDSVSRVSNQFFLTENDPNGDHVINFLREWFLSHTKKVDREFADHLNGK